MKKTIALLIALSFLVSLFAPASTPVSAADDERFYVGQVSALLVLGEATLTDFSELAGNYDGSAETHASMIAIGRTWAYMSDCADKLDPPSSHRDMHESVTGVFNHLKAAGEYVELGLLMNDPSYIELATAEIEAANDDLNDLNDLLGLD